MLHAQFSGDSRGEPSQEPTFLRVSWNHWPLNPPKLGCVNWVPPAATLPAILLSNGQSTGVQNLLGELGGAAFPRGLVSGSYLFSSSMLLNGDKVQKLLFLLPYEGEGRAAITCWVEPFRGRDKPYTP